MPSQPSKPEDIDTKSIISMQELDPSPVTDTPDVESGDYFPSNEPLPQHETGFLIPKLGLRGHRWDTWLTGFQKYSTYPPTAFFILHLANTSLIPLVTRSVPASEPYLLLTRPVYQAPGIEHLVLTLPILGHVASGIALRNIRAARRAKLYGAETRAQRDKLSWWPRMSLQARSGYVVAPLIGLHVLVNRATPVMVEGGSSGVGLGYVAHGFARSPIFWNVFYVIFVAASVWHFVGGWATWMGWRVTTVRKERGSQKGSLEGYLGYTESPSQKKRQRKMWWIVNGIAAVGASLWLAGALGVIGRGGEGVGWEAKGWNDMYSQVPVIGDWL
ncbi:hypothetical protein PENARI_c005G02995 [Penicillium arizonense]|uniref:Mitochondrial adapter protein MCP1 transmembrane domain-containing protein n=1 Tax=Penicillium arizonense TaxID=1835702 RepID=A0A1F5LP37_PENAI|nr:hypothetical protein PENARI_c005G02995 [Penicillium arizonense]OGE54982.1 hypothetical protein PENARI_c005G02995 [Penicillium arizonense]